MRFWGTFIVARADESVSALGLESASSPTTSAGQVLLARAGGRRVAGHPGVFGGPDGCDSAELPAAWEGTLRALMAQTGHPVLAAVVLDSDARSSSGTVLRAAGGAAGSCSTASSCT